MSGTRQSTRARTILEVVVGSTVHGVAVKDGLEDLDLLAVAIEEPELVFGFHPEDTWVERTKPVGVRSEAGDIDRTVYGLRKFLHLALKGNPTILLAFFVHTPFVRESDRLGRELQALSPHVVSKQVFAPFRGYMRQQHERLLGLRGQRNVTRPELVVA
jgi:predicted nucleotidyltransferase